MRSIAILRKTRSSPGIAAACFFFFFACGESFPASVLWDGRIPRRRHGFCLSFFSSFFFSSISLSPAMRMDRARPLPLAGNERCRVPRAGYVPALERDSPPVPPLPPIIRAPVHATDPGGMSCIVVHPPEKPLASSCRRHVRRRCSVPWYPGGHPSAGAGPADNTQTKQTRGVGRPL